MLCGQTPFPKKITRAQQGDNGFLSRARNDREFNFALANIEDRIRRFSLRKNRRGLVEGNDFSTRSRLGKETFDRKPGYYFKGCCRLSCCFHRKSNFS